jgi:ABC-type multidrug transport system fused ATPase/permease subunit
MIIKSLNFLEKKEKSSLKLIFFLNSFNLIFEFISLSLLPIFLGLITNQEFFFNLINDNFLLKINQNIEINKFIYYFSFLIIISFFIKNGFLFLLLIVENKFFKNFKLRLSKKLFNFYINAPYLNLVNFNTSDISRTIVYSVSGAFYYMQNLITLLREILAVCAIFIILIFVNPKAVLIIFLILSLLSALYYGLIKSFLKKSSEKNQLLVSRIIKILIESFGSIKDIKILSKENKITKIFNYDIDTLEKNFFFYNLIQRLPKLFLELLFITLLTSIFAIYSSYNSEFITLLPELTLYVVVSLRFIPAFNSISSSLNYLKIYESSILTINKQLKTLTQRINLSSPRNNNKNFSLKKKSKSNFIEVKNLHFSYLGKSKNILKNINLKIKEGSKVAIFGKTGSGKTTFLNLLLGLFEPQKGDVFYKNKSIYKNLDHWRSDISHISQNCYLMDDTIKNNIIFNFYNKDINESKLNKVVKLSQLDKKIKSLPKGLNTRIGNDGIRLSGGEKQRIALARSMYRNSSILFLDEFTSALDLDTEEKIIKNVMNYFRGKTMFIISHRDTIIKNCDIILKVEDGNIKKIKNFFKKN